MSTKRAFTSAKIIIENLSVKGDIAIPELVKPLYYRRV